MATPTSYQRVVSSTDYDIANGRARLETDGSDDWMQTNPIDFTGTDKVSVFTGVRKLSDAAFGVILELSTSIDTNNGAFFLVAPRTGGQGTFGFRSKGTLIGDAATANSYPAPYSAVLVGVGNVSGDSAVLRLNGGQVAQATVDQGAGTYGNYPLYLFRRGGTSLPFNGHFYGLTIVGRLCTDAETRNVERLYANKTGVVLA